LFERRNKPLISNRAFAKRMLIWVFITTLLTLVSLVLGVIGYRYFESMTWLDAFLNAAMIFGGMGEIDVLHTTAGKMFAALYAIYSGVFLVVCGGLLLVPIFHRVLHHFHQDE